MARRIRLPSTSRFTARSLSEHVERNPGLSLVVDEGKQYLVAASWRRRSDIAELVEISRGERRAELVETLAERLAERGVKLLVLDYGLGALEAQFFQAEGFHVVERIVELERPDLPIDPYRPPAFAVRHDVPADRDDILELERESFTWLWWNSPAEWDSYRKSREVEVYVGQVNNRIVGYAGLVVYGREGHLDRLAVRASEQGHGYGAGLLTTALQRLRERGAKRVALTTQETNLRSQALYFRNGFQRSRWTYDIHGKWLDDLARLGHDATGGEGMAP